jgi:outer membrane protein X
MKKLMMIAAFVVAALTANAQNEPGKMAIGANVNYGMHKDYKNIGFGAKFQYNVTDAIRGEASGNYFLKKDYCTMWDANINFHYVIPISESLNVYPLVGATLIGVKLDASDVVNDAYNTAWEAAKAYGMSKEDFDATWNSGVAVVDASTSDSETKFGFNAGAGIEYFISPNLKVNAEVKYQYVKDYDRPVISAGVAYIF